MPFYLGIDTSNYTTSAAIYDSDNNKIYQEKQLLAVSGEAVGLRQSDAVFAHVKQLSLVIDRLCKNISEPIKAVCVSAFPRSVEGSYMPCFLVGKMVAESVASLNNINCHYCSHQDGHIVAAAYSANKLSLLGQEFYAFHVSGGTTECLEISPDKKLFKTRALAKTLDINAGQLIDRTGVMLGIPFPCGVELDRISRLCGDKIKIKVSLNGLDCNMSGFQNKVQKLKTERVTDEYIARYAIEAVKSTVVAMSDLVKEKHGEKPFLYAGGVMSNSIIRGELVGDNVFFADPIFSSDNAAGVAIIAGINEG